MFKCVARELAKAERTPAQRRDVLALEDLALAFDNHRQGIVPFSDLLAMPDAGAVR